MLELLYFLFAFIFILLFLYVILISIYSIIRGAPYAALGSQRLKTMIELSNIKKGQKMADLGSGDGRIVIAAASLGANAYGYEINPLLILLSRRKIKQAKVEAKILQKDFWSENFASYDLITIYGIPYIMKEMEQKLKKELKPGAIVVSNHFKFPTWKITKSKNDVHLYVK